MIYFKNRETETIGVGTSLPIGDEYIVLTKEMYDEAVAALKRQDAVQRQAELLQQRAIETDELQLLLIQRELDELSEYWESLEPMEVTYGTDN